MSDSSVLIEITEVQPATTEAVFLVKYWYGIMIDWNKFTIIFNGFSRSRILVCVFRSIQAGIPFHFRPPFRRNSGHTPNELNGRWVGLLSHRDYALSTLDL